MLWRASVGRCATSQPARPWRSTSASARSATARGRCWCAAAPAPARRSCWRGDWPTWRPTGTAPERVLAIGSTRATARRLRERAEALLDGSLRGALDRQLGRARRAAAARARRGRRPRPLLRRARPGRAAGDAARPARPAAAAPARDPRQPGRPAGAAAGPDRRAEGASAVGPTSLETGARRREQEAGDEAEREAARRELEFAELFTAHDRILAASGSLDRGDVFLALDCLLVERPDVRRQIAERFEHLMVDELEEATRRPAHDPGGARRRQPEPSLRAGERRRGGRGDRGLVPPGPPRGRGDRAARSASASRGCASGAAPTSAPRRRRWPARSSTWSPAAPSPEQICVLLADAGAARAAPSRRRWRSAASPSTSPGRRRCSQRPEVRDAIAWLRVLADPDDSPAAARALTRPPIELRSGDLARLTTIARRRKLDMVAACEAALDSPQFQPEARERIQAFLKLYNAASAAMEERRADVFVRRLIERVGLRRQRLFAAQPEVAERLLGLSRLAELATAWARREPHGSTRGFVALPQRRRRGRRRTGRRRGAALARRGPGRSRWRRSRGSASTTSSCSGSRRRRTGRGSAGRRAAAWSSRGSSAARRARPAPRASTRRLLAARGRPRRSTARSSSARPRACTRPTGRCASRCSRPPGRPAASSPSRASTPRSTSTGRSPATWSC